MIFLDFVEEVFSKNPVFLVGSGTSCGAGISGMGALGTYLVNNVSLVNFDETDIQHWDVFKQKIGEDLGLEEVLQGLGNVSERFTKAIVQGTWKCILSDEMAPFTKIADGEDLLGFSRLFKRYKSTTVNCINIITTNYDHLIEISAAVEDWEVWDGFSSGMLSKPINYSDFKKRMRQYITVGRNPQFDDLKHIKIYKPHGSLSWFKRGDDSFVKIPSISSIHDNMLKDLEINPVIVTPGIGKYLETHFEPYSNIMAEMQRSIREARAMIFLGFGFNDIHIQASFQSVLRNESIPKLIATRSLSPSFFALVARGELKNYFAIEKHEDGSRIISDRQEEIINPGEVWSFNGLLKMAWGEG